MAAIRSGLEQVVPLGLLKLLSWKELETLVCGKPILDIDLLKQNTVYRVILFFYYRDALKLIRL